MAVSQTRIHMIGSTISNWCYNNNGHFFIRTNESTGCILIVWWASASNDWGTHFLRTTLLFLRKISLIYTPQPLSRSLLRTKDVSAPTIPEIDGNTLSILHCCEGRQLWWFIQDCYLYSNGRGWLFFCVNYITQSRQWNQGSEYDFPIEIGSTLSLSLLRKQKFHHQWYVRIEYSPVRKCLNTDEIDSLSLLLCFASALPTSLFTVKQSAIKWT